MNIPDFIKDPHLPIILIIGMSVFIGTLISKLFQRLRIPQVVGYIVIGLFLGNSGIGFITPESIEKLRYFNFFALGIIGFMIGGELHRDVFKKYGKQFIGILVLEGISAFFIVGILSGLITYFVTSDVSKAVALGLILGAISSATAPAATVDVLWEYKARGPLTTAVFAIVALDDGLALLLYGISASIAAKLVGGSGSILEALGHSGYELFGAIVIGIGAGWGLNFLIRSVRDHDKTLTFVLGTLGMVIGLNVMLGLDLILSSMTLGLVVMNLAPRRSRESFDIIERFAPPIFVLFFVIVGARLSIGSMTGWMWILAIAFVLGRSLGKIFGAGFGGRIFKAHENVRKYLGLCLFSQAGVAIGLAILASDRFTTELTAGITVGDAVILIVTATTFLVQIIGPPCVKVAIEKAGEAGMNVTEEDILAMYKVRDVMDSETPAFAKNTTITVILPQIARTNTLSYPVIDSERSLLGIITLDSLKSSFISEGLIDWLLAFDVMSPVTDVVTEDIPLSEAITRMREQELEYLPVVQCDNNNRLAGMIEYRAVNRFISNEILKRSQQSDA